MINDNELDFQPGLDFTVVNPFNPVDLNNGIQSTVPLKDVDETQGKGLNLVTTDVNPNTPSVPNPTTSALFNKWARYTWVRRPFAGSVDKRSKRYTWNDDAPNDAILLKWVLDFTDTTNADNNSAEALAAANNAVAIANNAGTLAGNATTAANEAQDTATNAANAAATATQSATDATNAATTATAAANAATTAANNAVAGNPTQKKYVKLTETQAKGTDAGASLGGKNTRVLNTIDYNGVNNPVTLDAVTGKITITVAGFYYICAFATCYDNSANQHQLLLVTDADNITQITGSSIWMDANAISTRSELNGIMFINANTVLRLDHYIANPQAANGQGRAANVHPDVGGREVYSGITFLYLTAQ